MWNIATSYTLSLLWCNDMILVTWLLKAICWVFMVFLVVLRIKVFLRLVCLTIIPFRSWSHFISWTLTTSHVVIDSWVKWSHWRQEYSTRVAIKRWIKSILRWSRRWKHISLWRSIRIIIGIWRRWWILHHHTILKATSHLHCMIILKVLLMHCISNRILIMKYIWWLRATKWSDIWVQHLLILII